MILLTTKNLLVQILATSNRLISDEVRKVKESGIPLNTRHNTAWAVRAWKEWADERNDEAPAKEKVDSGIGKVNDVELKHCLAEFVVEVRKKTSKEYICFLLMWNNICVKYQSLVLVG